MATQIAIKLNAGHTSNGNPRRCIVVLDVDGIVDVVDEGYRGHGALKHAGYPNLQVQAEFETTASEYRNLLKTGKRK